MGHSDLNDVRLEGADAGRLIDERRGKARRMLEAVGWQSEQIHVHRHADGVSLAISAPLDALYAATDINDWAWQATRSALEGGETPAVEADALRLREAIAKERNPALSELVTHARHRHLPCLVDDEFVTLRVPYPLGFYSKGFEGRIDDAEAGWKGRGLWVPSGDRTPWLKEGGKGTKPLVVQFQMRPSPLATSGSRSIRFGQISLV